MLAHHRLWNRFNALREVLTDEQTLPAEKWDEALKHEQARIQTEMAVNPDYRPIAEAVQQARERSNQRRKDEGKEE
jgi:hypothetical protein